MTSTDTGLRPLGASERGFLLGRWQRAGDGQPSDPALFVMGQGALLVGEVRGSGMPGVRGWIDDFKVFAFAPNRQVACELAQRTLIDLDAVAAGDLERSRTPWVAGTALVEFEFAA